MKSILTCIAILFKCFYISVVAFKYSIINYSFSLRKIVLQNSIDYSNCISNQQNTKKVYIRVSDVASILGNNIYQPYNETFIRYWNEISPQTCNIQTTEIRKENIKQKLSKNTNNQIYQIIKSNKVNSINLQENIQQIANTIRQSKTISLSEKEELQKFLISDIRKVYGIQKEEDAAKFIQKTESTKYMKDSKMYSLLILKQFNREYYLRGKIDYLEVLDDDNLVLVEIKNRVNRIFYRLVDYEYIQVQCYLQLLPYDISYAKLVEKFDNETNTIIIERDDPLWLKYILPGLIKFIQELSQKITVEEEKLNRRNS